MRCANRLEISVKLSFFAALALMASLAQAQKLPPDPADPAVEVPQPAYRSVFADTPAGVEAGSADWRRANAEVGQFRRGHIDLLKWEEERAAAGAGPASPAAPTRSHRHSHGGQP